MRVKIIFVFIGLSALLWLIPHPVKQPGEISPETLVELSFMDQDFKITPDELAKLVVNEDSNLILIDLRDSIDYKICNIPGSINIPFQHFMDEANRAYFAGKPKKMVLYSNDDILANEALVLALRRNYTNTLVLEGGMNNWYRTIMLSEFSGDQISPEENALYETRYEARRFFTRINSLPDSLKTAFLQSKRAEEKKLVGGCE